MLVERFDGAGNQAVAVADDGGFGTVLDDAAGEGALVAGMDGLGLLIFDQLVGARDVDAIGLAEGFPDFGRRQFA